MGKVVSGVHWTVAPSAKWPAAAAFYCVCTVQNVSRARVGQVRKNGKHPTFTKSYIMWSA